MLLVSGAVSHRRTHLETRARPIELYTFGAPKLSSNHKKWPRKGCFAGVRAENEVYRENGHNVRDIVTWLLASYRHPEMNTLRLFDDPKRSEEKPCGWTRNRDKSAQASKLSEDLHEMELYIDRSMTWGGKVGEVADVALRFSYHENHTKWGPQLRAKGWGLVYNVEIQKLWGKEVSHLMQHPATLECMLTFEGTDRRPEWLGNMNIFPLSFCGFGWIHAGFRNFLHRITTSGDWQKYIRPNLGYCSKLNVVGHSLGGAMASLFVGCVQSGNKGRKEYENLSIDWKTPKLLDTRN